MAPNPCASSGDAVSESLTPLSESPLSALRLMPPSGVTGGAPATMTEPPAARKRSRLDESAGGNCQMSQRTITPCGLSSLSAVTSVDCSSASLSSRTHDAARRGRGSSGELLTRNFYHTDAFSESLRPENGITPSLWRGVGGSRLEPDASFSPASRCDDRLPPAEAGERAPFSYVKACALSCQGTAQPFWTSY